MLGVSPSNKSTISTNPCLHKVFNPNLNLKTKLIGVCVNTLIYVSNLPPTAIQDEPWTVRVKTAGTVFKKLLTWFKLNQVIACDWAQVN